MMYPLMAEASSTVPVKLMCTLAQLPRCGYYRSLHREHAGDDPEELRLRDQIQQICLRMSRYGYRRVTAELHRRGYPVNHKRVLRLLRKDNLLCLRRKRWIRTTDSRHGYRVYPNLARDMTVTDPNQLWVADITYIRLVHEFVYLAVILDAFSRRTIGWALGRSLDTSLTIAALQMALSTRHTMAGLVHHSDQGVQYAAHEYVALLTANNIAISMGRKGNPYDNATAESFIKTLKHEEVHLNDYNSFFDAYDNISHFIEIVYNHNRLHSALGYRPPAEYEACYLHSQLSN